MGYVWFLLGLKGRVNRARLHIFEDSILIANNTEDDLVQVG